MVAADKGGIDALVARQKIGQALLRLGVGFSDCAGVVRYDPEAETAFWRHNPVTGEEAIHVGPTVAAMSVALSLIHI